MLISLDYTIHANMGNSNLIYMESDHFGVYEEKFGHEYIYIYTHIQINTHTNAYILRFRTVQIRFLVQYRVLQIRFLVQLDDAKKLLASAILTLRTHFFSYSENNYLTPGVFSLPLFRCVKCKE